MGSPGRPVPVSMGLFAEMQRRNVFKVAFVYLFGAALAYWLSVVVQTQLGLPWWTSRLIALLLCVGFPAALIFAWVYEITPSGLKKAIDVDQTQSIVFKTGQKLNAALAVVIVLGAVAMVADRLLPELAVVEPPPPPKPLKPGDLVGLVVPHCDPTINFFDWYHCLRGDALVEVWPIEARGCSS